MSTSCNQASIFGYGLGTQGRKVHNISDGFTLDCNYENLYIRNISTSDVIIAIPLDMNTYSPYAEFIFVQAYTGTITISPATGVTLNFNTVTSNAGDMFMLKKISRNEYDLVTM